MLLNLGPAMLIATSFATGATIFGSGNVALTAASPLQTGKLKDSPNGDPSQWDVDRGFPGVADPGHQFHYDVFQLAPGPYSFLQITFDAESSDTFASAYLNSYVPNSTSPNYGLETNYLGDAGGQGAQFSNPRVFQVEVASPETQNVSIVVNDASLTDASLNRDFRIVVDGYTDTSFDDTPTATPEPATTMTSTTGLLAALVLFVRRKKAA